MKITNVEEMRALDRVAVEKFGIEEKILMENAGLAAYSVLLKKMGVNNKKIIVFCGVGNNGGDGFVVARKIHSNGGEVKVFILGDKNKFKGAARMNLDIAEALPVEILQVESIESVKKDVLHSDAVVDAIFGTGLMRNVEGLYRDVIELINASGKKVLSVDIPSGVSGDTGQIMGTAVKADCTVTFGLPKIGNVLYPGYSLCGELYVTHISFPPSLYKADSLSVEINFPAKLPPRNPKGHKGDFGDVLFIAGALSYFGAPCFAAYSFLRAGGGYSRLASPESMIPFLANRANEIVFIPQKETASGSISLKNKDTLLELSEKTDMVILGPGLSLDEETQRLIRELAKEISKPMLIDGDGITAFCDDLEIIKQRKPATILTPHLGEMSRITNMPVSAIDADKIGVLQKTAGELNSIMVLKGAHSLIGYPDRRVFINLTGNSGMATAGSGDVLTGTIAGMFGLGMSIQDAVKKGVFIHGLSGDLAAHEKGEDGITASDVLNCLPQAVKTDREGISETLRKRYVGAIVV